MPKAKLKFEKSLLKKVKVAATFSDTKIGDSQNIGNSAIVELNFKAVANAVEFGRLLETVTGEEVKDQKDTGK